MNRARVAALCSVAALHGCATSPETSQLLGERFILTNLDTHPVQIVSVDGRSTTLRPVPVAPGQRRVVLRGPPGGAGFSEVQALALEVAPCTRYYLVAVKANPLDTTFTPRVDHAMPLGSHCRSPG
jgi:FtsP/CotA-like multicopper oxidase with cupredoxin domain